MSDGVDVHVEKVAEAIWKSREQAAIRLRGKFFTFSESEPLGTLTVAEELR